MESFRFGLLRVDIHFIGMCEGRDECCRSCSDNKSGYDFIALA